MSILESISEWVTQYLKYRKKKKTRTIELYGFDITDFWKTSLTTTSRQKIRKKGFWITLVFQKYWAPNFQNIFVLSIAFVRNIFWLCHIRWCHFMTSYVILDFFSILANFGGILWLNYSWVDKNLYLIYASRF